MNRQGASNINCSTVFHNQSPSLTMIPCHACRVCTFNFLNFMKCGLEVIHQAWDAVFHHQKKHQEESWKNTTRSRVFLTNFEVFHLVMKHCVEFFAWYLFSNKIILDREIKRAKMSSFSSDFQTLIKHLTSFVFSYELLISLRTECDGCVYIFPF